MTRPARLLACLLAPLAIVSPAAAEPGVLCAAPAFPPRPDNGPGPTAAALVGEYRCSEEGIAVVLRLDADGRFVQRLTAGDALDTDDNGAPVREVVQTGRWRVVEDKVQLFARPTRAPVLRLIAATRDPSVRMRVEIREPGGAPAADLLIGEGEDANPISALDQGVVLVPLSYGWTPGLRQVVRGGDELVLARFTVGPTGPNSFRYEYRPSEIEPFEQTLRVGGAGWNAIAVPLGIGGAILRRVGS